MVFSSTTFLLAFLPLVAILYYICPRKLRNGLLLVFSLLFYGWGEPKYILIMLFSTVFDYCNGLAIGHFRSKGREGGAKAVLVISVVGNLAILGFFKYTDFAISNLNGLLGTAIPALGLLLPIGISFYTFQTMSYTIDVYRGLVPPQRNIVDFGAYVTLFPQLIAGPIVQYKTVAYDLEHRRESVSEASEGLQRLVIGLGKKVLIANHGGDHTIYPDCRPEFIKAIDEAAEAGTFVDVRVVAPYTNITKGEIAAIGKKLGIDYAETWSCYKGGEKHCGKCGTCVERKEALAAAGIEDTTEYEE